MTNNSEPAIRLENVIKVYPLPSGDVTALKGINISIKKGEFVAIMGPSGSGKSTLLNQIGSLDVPTSGDLYIGGINIREMSDDELTEMRRDNIGFIFQKFNLIPLLSIYENVEYPLILQKRKRDSERKAEKLLEMVGLAGSIINHKPTEISGGQQQRVAIARALINDPKIILCDEPTGNLDSATSEQIMEILTRLNRQGKTVIMVTHDPETAGYATRTIVIRDGLVA
ncbi:ABC transporter ATP-binding protein [Methanoplanus sp. FWC-SCC4]|uniref:ABC transporter ATP-binding protein n=1 Tax=Methanochimaera problematica TaxID=2609417 RepID=A0AA97FB84_9EURY|nr:ABC transporter ATP-binding protein [Methanoplanus sp. FWC-SCC4]WOF16225.1 ABC transporter ATP-binding protein [Methanoplanus sp. FWC-SCC4]